MTDSENAQSKIRVLLAFSDGAAAAQLMTHLHNHDLIEIVGLARTGEDAMQQAVEKRPRIVVISHDLSRDDPLWNARILVERIRSYVLGARTIILSNNGARPGLADDEFGPVDAILGSDSNAHDVIEWARRLAGRPEWVEPKKRHIIAVTAAKGGVGKTTIACNLALALQLDVANEEEHVALFDLYTQYGSAERILGIKAEACALDLIHRLNDLDRSLLESVMAEHESGVRLLVGSRRTAEKEALYSCAAPIVSALRQCYRFVVLDVPNELSDTVESVLPLCSKIVLVANLNDYTTMEQTSRMHADLLRRKIDGNQVLAILNQHSWDNTFRPADIRDILPGCKTICVPDDRKVRKDNNMSTPTVYNRPRSRFSRAIRQIVTSLVHEDSLAVASRIGVS